MKKLQKFILAFLLLCSLGLVLAACEGDTKTISIQTSNVEVEVKDADSLDLKTLFKITDDGKEVEVTDEMIDKGNYKAEIGTYEVKVTYTTESASSIVNVIANKEPVIKKLDITSKNIVIELAQAANYDLKSLFTISDDGNQITVEDSMINNGGYKAEVGKYEITLTYNEHTAKATIEVVESFVTNVDIVGKNQVIELSAVNDLDLKTLFTITENGVNVPVTDAMINKGSFKAEVGTYEITLTYADHTAKATVEIVDKFVVVHVVEVTGVNQIVEVGAMSTFDYTTLFVIKEDNQNVTVRNNWITKTNVNEEQPGTYEVSISYTSNDVTYTATSKLIIVENDTVVIAESDASNDVLVGSESFDYKTLFKIYVGLNEVTVTDEMIDASKVDLNHVGLYDVVLNYDRFGEEYTKTVKLNVFPEVEIKTPLGESIEGRHYGAGRNEFDPTKIFEIYVAGEQVDVEEDMVESNVEFFSGYAKTGEYSATLTINVNGVIYTKTIEYKLWYYEVASSFSKPETATSTYYSSELLKDEIDVANMYGVRVNGSAAGSDSSNIIFLPEGAEAPEEVPEGKTVVYYKESNDIAFDGETNKAVPGKYTGSISFTLEDTDYSQDITIVITDDVRFTASNKVVFVGATTVDYTSMFTSGTVYDETYQYHTRTVYANADMIDSSKVNLTQPGTYEVICNGVWENSDKTVKKTGTAKANLIVLSAEPVGDYVCTNSSTFKVSVNGTAEMGYSKYTITDYADGVYTLGTSYKFTITNGVLLLVSQSATVMQSSCYTFYKADAFDGYNVATGYLSGSEKMDEVGNKQYVITELYKNDENGDKASSVYFVLCLDVYEVVPGYYSDTAYKHANYYVISDVTGDLFTEKKYATMTVDEEELVFYFTAAGTFTAYPKDEFVEPEEPEAPVDPVGPGEAEPEVDNGVAYTGSNGTITLFKDGTATAEGDITEKINKYMESYDIYYIQIGEYTVLYWKKDYSNYNYLVVQLTEGDSNTFVEAERDDKAPNIYSDSGAYVYIDFYGYGIAIMKQITVSDMSFGAYEVNGSTITITYTQNDVEYQAEYEFANGNNEIHLVACDTDHFYTSTDTLKYKGGKEVVNNRLTKVNSDVLRLPQNGKFDINSFFKFETMVDEAVTAVEITEEMYNISGLDMSTPGYYVFQFNYTTGGFDYYCENTVYIYAAPYANHPYVGTWWYGTPSSYGSDKLELHDDGTIKYGYSDTGTWTVDEDGNITLNCSKGELEAFVYGDVMFIADYYSSTSKTTYRLAVNPNNELNEYKQLSLSFAGEDRILTMVTLNGITMFYYSEGENFYGQVSVKFDALEFTDAKEFIVSLGEEEFMHGTAKTSSSFGFKTYTGEKGKITFDGSGDADVDGKLAKYTVSKSGNYNVTIDQETFVFKLDDTSSTYQVLTPDAVIGKYSKGSRYFDLDGFGGGEFFAGYSEQTITYTVSEDGKTVTINTYSSYTGDVDDTFVFTVNSDGNLVCSSSTYSYYVTVGDVYIKE